MTRHKMIRELIGRRQFLRDTGLKTSGLITFGFAASQLRGCTLPTRTFRPADASLTIRIPIDLYPELREDDGVLRIVDRTGGTYYVRRFRKDLYRAFSAICTHQGCTIDAVPQGFDCPCHGSRYNREGTNIAGPAPRPLPSFPARIEGDTVVVELASPTRPATRKESRQHGV